MRLKATRHCQWRHHQKLAVELCTYLKAIGSFTEFTENQLPLILPDLGVIVYIGSCVRYELRLRRLRSILRLLKVSSANFENNCMPTSCCVVPDCNNRGGHEFPKDPKVRKAWIVAVRLESCYHKGRLWQPTANSLVCKGIFYRWTTKEREKLVSAFSVAP